MGETATLNRLRIDTPISSFLHFSTFLRTHGPHQKKVPGQKLEQKIVVAFRLFLVCEDHRLLSEYADCLAPSGIVI